MGNQHTALSIDGKRSLACVETGDAKSIWVLLNKEIAEELLDHGLRLSLNDYSAHDADHNGAVGIYSLGLDGGRLEGGHYPPTTDILGDGGSPEISAKVVLSLRCHPCQRILMTLVCGRGVVVHRGIQPPLDEFCCMRRFRSTRFSHGRLSRWLCCVLSGRLSGSLSGCLSGCLSRSLSGRLLRSLSRSLFLLLLFRILARIALCRRHFVH